MTSCTSVVDLQTASDEDFAWAFQWQVDGVNFDFTGSNLMMMVRKNVTDAEVFISLDSIPGGQGGIIFNVPTPTGTIETFNIEITRNRFINMPPDVYVQSLVLLTPDGLRQEVWNGTLTHNIGPTR
jgi:hypothetical protein